MDKPENPIFATRRTNLRRIAKDPETLALLTQRSGDDAFGVPCIDAYLSGARPITDTEAELLENLLGLGDGKLSESHAANQPIPQPPPEFVQVPTTISWPMLERLVDNPPSTPGAVLFGALMAIRHHRADSLAERLLITLGQKGRAA